MSTRANQDRQSNGAAAHAGAIGGAAGPRLEALERALGEAQRRGQRLDAELAAAHECVRRMSFDDPLTGLPNRVLFHDRLVQALEMARREKRCLPVLMMDLDRFKEINDTLGHRVGDELLREVARRLLSVVRGSDTVARLGGDEFAALLPTAASMAGALVVADKIVQSFAPPVRLADHSLDIEISIGIALFPEHGTDESSLLAGADMAMYEAKRCRLGCTVFRADQEQDLTRATLLPRQLSRAIDNDELRLCYQPKLDIRSGRVIGAEALVRWQHPEYGYLLPREFIPGAERSAVIRPLTFAILRQSLSDTEAWRRAGFDLSLAVNLSSSLLLDRGLPEQILDLLRERRVDPERLILEITETALMTDTERAMGVAKDLRAAGITISLDDFGTGYTSFNNLKKMSIAEVKIDQSFIQETATSRVDGAIVKSIVSLCRNLDIDVVAEGVESLDLLRSVERLGCPIVQGYQIGRPVPADEFLRGLENRPRARNSERRHLRPADLTPPSFTDRQPVRRQDRLKTAAACPGERTERP
ncbi:MAG: putative bifunctional diguanylate cyclase/phosphodiesterase [Pseudomonadota bacterium]